VAASGSKIVASSFSGRLARCEIGHMRIGCAGYVFSRSRGSGSVPSDAAADEIVDDPRRVLLG
jgi:hypothetical protein